MFKCTVFLVWNVQKVCFNSLRYLSNAIENLDILKFDSFAHGLEISVKNSDPFLFVLQTMENLEEPSSHWPVGKPGP